MKEIIEDFESRTFEYGSSDCCQFVGACVEAVRGYNPVTEWFDYDGEDGAKALIESYGNLATLVTVKLGAPCDDYQDGDVAMFNQTDGSQILGVVLGDDVVLKSITGVVRWPVNRAHAVWRT